jgi:hypothetical protein
MMVGQTQEDTTTMVKTLFKSLFTPHPHPNPNPYPQVAKKVNKPNETPVVIYYCKALLLNSSFISACFGVSQGHDTSQKACGTVIN